MSPKHPRFFLQISLIPLMVFFFSFLSSCFSDFSLIPTSRNNDCDCYCNKISGGLEDKASAHNAGDMGSIPG